MAKIISMFRNVNRLEYKLRAADHSRLSKDGLLTIYNMNEPVIVPVTRILGEWNISHIGKTLCLEKGEWKIKPPDEEV